MALALDDGAKSGAVNKKLLIFGSVFLSVFVLSFTVGSLFMLPSNSDAASTDTDVNITVASVLSMNTSSNNVDLEATPASMGTLVSGDVTASVSTNNKTGYTLSMSAKAASNVDLVHSNNTDKILNSTNTTATTLANNTWGYNKNTGVTPTVFLRIPAPTGPDTLLVTSAPATNSATTVTVAGKVDTSARAGDYTSELTFTAVANYVPVPKIIMQTVTEATCPAARTRVNDARDDATYWIKKMADGKCWMLTNLAYAGGGTNTYGDVKTINLNTTSNGATYTSPQYYTQNSSHLTTGTTDPSTSTDGGATNPQYGYLYNWCAAMGVQTGTDACSNLDTTDANAGISICPSGWRLPTSGTGGEFQQMTDAIGATSNGSSGGTAGSDALRSTWLGMYSGYWYDGYYNQGSYGFFWSTSQNYVTISQGLYFGSSTVNPSYAGYKNYGFAVRCVAE